VAEYDGRSSRNDWPYFGSLGEESTRPSGHAAAAPSTVWLPDMARLNENVTPAGQNRPGNPLARSGMSDRVPRRSVGGEFKPVEGLRLSELPATADQPAAGFAETS
jgi:hypothetical protein